MDAGAVDRVRAWLAQDDAEQVHPRVLDAAYAALGDPGRALRLEAHGSVVGYAWYGTTRRRAFELDRHATLGVALAWNDGGRLEDAAVRIADRSWILIEPRATIAEPDVVCDAIWRAGAPWLARDAAEPLTVVTCLDWPRVHIPTVADPARLPAGAGSALLNVIASLAADTGESSLVYRGPYPSEQLFLTMLESFRYASVDAPLDRFVAGELAWAPAPHERSWEPDGVYVQIRDRVEKVVCDGRTYVRADWPSIERHAPRRIHDVGDRVRCSLWALGAVIEDRLELTRDGDVRVIHPRQPDSRAPRAVDPSVTIGLIAVVAASSAAALASAIRDEAHRVASGWAAVDGDLVAIEGDRVRFSWRLRDVAVQRLAAASDRRECVAIAFALLGEMAALVGDALRQRAQSTLLALPAHEQARLLQQREVVVSASATEITDAVEALLDDLARTEASPERVSSSPG